MIFRFTLDNSIAGSKVIDEPEGWKATKLKLERDKEYHSLIEMIDTQFFFYNQGAGKDGGRQYLKDIEDTQGINALVTILIEISEDGGDSYDEVFEGNIDLSSIKDISKGNKFYKYGCNIIPNDLWSKFMNRKSQSVNLQSTTDLDGNSVSAPTTLLLNTTGQTLRKLSSYTMYSTTDDEFEDQIMQFTGTDVYGIIGLPKDLYNEIETKYNIAVAATDVFSGSNNVVSEPFYPFLEIAENGTYQIEIQIVLSNGGSYDTRVPIGGVGGFVVRLYVNATPYLLTRTDTGVDGIDGRTAFNYNNTFSLLKGDAISIICHNTSATATFDCYIVPSNVYIEQTYINITADTVWNVATTSEAFLIHEVANAIVKRVTSNSIYSEYFGGTSQGYPANGCAYLYGLTTGLLLRQFPLASKPMSMSFDDWWKGANPIFNLGLAPETVNGNEVIRIEDKGHFYSDDVSIYFANVNNIERSYDPTLIFKSIDIGYNTWSSENSSGLDDPQSKHTYSTLFKIVGSDVQISSSFIAASSVIEQGRRLSQKPSEDWRNDNNTFIIALANTTTPEVGSPFTSNLNGANTRYNVRLSVYRNALRWLNYLGGCLQGYAGAALKFISGEGNFKMVVGANSSACDPGKWTENQDIPIPDASPADFLVTPQKIMFTIDMSWTDYKTIRDNRTKAIGVSLSDSNFWICHISLLEYDITEAKATINAWIKY